MACPRCGRPTNNLRERISSHGKVETYCQKCDKQLTRKANEKTRYKEAGVRWEKVMSMDALSKLLEERWKQRNAQPENNY